METENGDRDKDRDRENRDNFLKLFNMYNGIYKKYILFEVCHTTWGSNRSSR